LEQLFSGYDFVKNLNNNSLKNQLNQSMVIATNKNNEEIKSVLKKYLDELESRNKSSHVLNQEHHENNKNKVRGVTIRSLDSRQQPKRISKNTPTDYLKKNNNNKRATFRFSVTEDPQPIKKIITKGIGAASEASFGVARTPRTTKRIRYRLIGGPKGIYVDNWRVKKSQKIKEKEIKEKKLEEIEYLETKQIIHKPNEIVQKPSIVIDIADDSNKIDNEAAQQNKTPPLYAQTSKPIVKAKKRYSFLGDKKPFKPFKPFKKTKITPSKVITPKKQDEIVVKRFLIKKDPPRIVKRNYSNYNTGTNSYSASDTSIANSKNLKEEIQKEPQIEKTKYKFAGQKKPFTPLYQK
jgi:hypothetical protein